VADTTTQTQIVREAPEIEAYKLGLLELAKQRGEVPINLPAYEVAGLTAEQQQAVRMAQEGIGSYLPYIQGATGAIQQGGSMYAGLPQYGANAVSAVTAGAGQALGYGGKGARAAGKAADLANTYGSTSYRDISGAARTATEAGFAGAQAYDPNAVLAYMNPYQEQVTRNTLAEMRRQGEITADQLSGQAVRSGAFGGSRQGIQQSELQRNVMEQMSRTAAQDYANNYAQAQQAAMNAFQNQQTRMQQAGNLALGAGQAQANTGISAGQLGVSGGQLESNAAMQAGNLALNAGQGIGQANVSAGQLQQAGAAGISALGQQQANLGQQLSGLQQGDVSFMYNLGGNLQGQQQKELEAARMTELQSQYEPLQRISWMSDIYKGAPSTQQTLATSTAPSPSPVSQAVGAGITGLSVYNLANK